MRKILPKTRAIFFGAALALALSLGATAATRTVVIDSGGTSRAIKSGRFFVVDSGGTTRKVKRLFVIDSGGTARLVYKAALLDTTLTIGSDGVANDGYAQGLYGSLGTTTYTDAGANSRTITGVIRNAAGTRLILNGGGISNSDTTFSEIDVNGLALSRASATYDGAFGGGSSSSWLWSGQFFTGAVTAVVPLVVL